MQSNSIVTPPISHKSHNSNFAPSSQSGSSAVTPIIITTKAQAQNASNNSFNLLENHKNNHCHGTSQQLDGIESSTSLSNHPPNTNSLWQQMQIEELKKQQKRERIVFDQIMKDFSEKENHKAAATSQEKNSS